MALEQLLEAVGVPSRSSVPAADLRWIEQRIRDDAVRDILASLQQDPAMPIACTRRVAAWLDSHVAADASHSNAVTRALAAADAMAALTPRCEEEWLSAVEDYRRARAALS